MNPPGRKRAGYMYKGHRRGLNQPAEAGFVHVAEGFSLTAPYLPRKSC